MCQKNRKRVRGGIGEIDRHKAGLKSEELRSCFFRNLYVTRDFRKGLNNQEMISKPLPGFCLPVFGTWTYNQKRVCERERLSLLYLCRSVMAFFFFCSTIRWADLCRSPCVVNVDYLRRCVRVIYHHLRVWVYVTHSRHCLEHIMHTEVPIPPSRLPSPLRH